MPQKNIKFTLQYDGTGFHGWQRQPGQRTVQGELEKAIEQILRLPLLTEGASRTDAGVHAFGQTVNFQTESDMEPPRLAAAVNSRLPEDVKVTCASEVPPEFSSRFWAKGKIYHYLLLNTDLPHPLQRHRVLHFPGILDTKAMSAAAELIRGERDYAAFANQTSPDENTVCNMEKVSVEHIQHTVPELLPESFIRIEVRGNRFLYKMVRTIAGTLVEVGKGKLPPGEITGIIEKMNRRNAGPTLKAHGLYLMKVLY